MNLRKLNQKGVGHLAGLVVILVLVAVAFVAWRVFNQQQVSTMDSAESTSQQEEIKNTNDLENAEKELNGADLDELDTSELDAAEEDLL